MRRTSAADLLSRMDRLARELVASDELVDRDHWSQFDATLYRTLYELTSAARSDLGRSSSTRGLLLRMLSAYPAPLNIPTDRNFSVEQAARMLEVSRRRLQRQIRTGRIQLVPGISPRMVSASSLQKSPRIDPADPADPHLLARLSTTLGALADLLSQNNRSVNAVALDGAAISDTARHVLSVGAVAARHTIAHCAIETVDRPLRIARYASSQVDALETSPRRPAPLEHVAAVAPGGSSTSINYRLDSALHAWAQTADREAQRLVPSTEALASIASQGVRLYAVTHQLLGSDLVDQPAQIFREVEGHLRHGGAALRQAEQALKGITSLTTPTHDYVTAARELFTTLQDVRELAAHHEGGIDPVSMLASLAHGCTLQAQVMTAARGVPAHLLHCHLLFAPARNLQPTIARLNARSNGKFIPVTVGDAPELAWRWDRAAAAAPEVSAALQRLVAAREVAEHDRGLELGR
jgi:hypothetical protein